VQDTGNPVYDMARNLFGRITSTANIKTHDLTIENPFTAGGAGACGLPSPPYTCVSTPQGLSNHVNRRTPYVEEYELNVQHQLAANMVLEFGYLGSEGHFLQRILTLNLPTPSPTGSIVSREAAPEFGNIQYMAGVVNSTYNALSVKLTRRLSQGLTFLVGYTFSKSIDDGSAIRALGRIS
jgi:hypothetical protein